jgi:hypothetical protein
MNISQRKKAPKRFSLFSESTLQRVEITKANTVREEGKHNSERMFL